MKKQTEHWLIYGGLAVAGVLLLTSAAPVVQSVVSNEPSVPSDTPSNVVPLLKAALKAYKGDPQHAPVATYAQALAENPNQGNANYTLTDSEANQLIANYLDLRQVLDPPDANQGRLWWKKYGPGDKRVFVPLVPPMQNAFSGDPKLIDYDGTRDGVLNHPTSGGGSGWFGTALSIASTVIGFLGVNDPPLNDLEKKILFMGGAIALDILPMYNTHNAQLSLDKLNAVMLENV